MERADGVDLGDDHASALILERLGTTLPDVTVATNDGHLAGDHHVGGPIQSIDDRVTASVEVVEFRLGHRVVHVDGGEEQGTVRLHFVQAMYTRRGLLGDADDVRREPMPLPRILCSGSTQKLENDPPLLGFGLWVEIGDLTRVFIFDTPVDEERRVTSVVHDQVGAAPVGPLDRLVRAPPVLLQRLSLPGKDGNTLGVLRCAFTTHRDRRRRVILRRKDIAGDPAHVGAEVQKGLDQHRGLHGHME